jgi:hypothetical protein
MEDPYDSKYVLKHLSDYINFQLNQGYEPTDIFDVLTKYGYKKEIIDDFLKKAVVLDKNQKKLNSVKIGAKEMNKELYTYLHNMLVTFIVKEKEQGYSIMAIKKALLNYGHNPEIVNSAIVFTQKKDGSKMKEESKDKSNKNLPSRKMQKKAQKKPTAKGLHNEIKHNIYPKVNQDLYQDHNPNHNLDQGQNQNQNHNHNLNHNLDQNQNHNPNHNQNQDYNHRTNPKVKHSVYSETTNYKTKAKKKSFGIPAGILYFMLIVILFAFVMFISVATGDDILIIMLSFFPTLLSLTVIYVAILQFRSRKAVNMMAIVGVALTVFIYIAMLQLNSPIQNLSDSNLVLVLNIFVSFILGSLLVTLSRLPKFEKEGDDEEAIPIEHHKPDSDEKLGEEIEHGSKGLQHESKELEKIIAQGQKYQNEIDKLPEREYKPSYMSARRISKRRLKIKPID